MIDLTWLRYFLTVAEAGSFSQAARRLGVSQPTLSVQVARLEEELGTSLLRRHSGGVEATAAGQRLIASAQKLLANVAEIEREVRATSSEPSGPLRIATVPSVGTYLLPEVLDGYLRRFPQVRPSLVYALSTAGLEDLEHGRADLAVIASAQQPPTTESVRLGDDPLVLACGPGHRLWGRKLIKPKDLEGERFVGLEAGSPTGRLVEHFLGRHKVHVTWAGRATEVTALAQLVRIGFGLAFLPRLAVRGLAEGGTIHIATMGAELHRALWACWNTPEPLPAREAFVAALREALG